MSGGGFDTEFERDVVARALQDEGYLRKALPVLRRHHFADKTTGWIWTTLADLYDSTHEVPTAAVWAAAIDRGHRSEEDEDYAAAALVALRKRKVKAPKSALANLRRFVRMAVLRKGGDEAMDLLERGDIDGAERALAGGVGDARTAAMLSEPTDWADAAEDRLAGYVAASARLAAPFPLPKLNELVCGGLPPGRVALVVANTNVGKSGFAVDVGYTAVTKGVDDGWVVVHVCTEESEAELGARYDARLTGINKDRLMSGTLDAGERRTFKDKFAMKGASLRNRLFLVELPPGSSIAGVRSALEHAREVHPEAPILLVVDSPDHLTPVRKMDNNRLEQSAVYWYMKGLTMEPEVLGKVAAWCTTQAPGAFEGKTLTTKAVSESYDKARIADFMFGLMEGDAVASTSASATGEVAVEGIIIKNRLTRAKRWLIYMSADLGICRYRQTHASAAPATEEE